ncbi:MAG: hypothetical protein H6702_19640 [Myxococcales bacterium]|nr:hypothetical protein [Myxococcales bacterium]
MRALPLPCLLLPGLLVVALSGCDDDGGAATANGYLECDGAQTCDLECPATGECRVEVAGNAQATVRCGTGTCEVDCAAGARCAVSCKTGDCAVTCTGSAACTQRCNAGQCTLTCDAATQSCQQIEGTGEATCTGCTG